MNPIIAAVASAAYVLIAVRCYVVAKRKRVDSFDAGVLAVLWPLAMLLIGIFVPLSGNAGAYGENS